MRRIKEFIADQFNFFVAAPAVIWQIMFLWIPILVLVVLSIVRFDADWRFVAFTAQNYRTLFDKAHLYIIGRSVALALFTSFLCLFVAYPVAYYLALRVKKGKSALLFLLTLPFWVNFLVHVYSWFFILDYHGIINTFLINIGVISKPLYLLNSSFAVALVMFYCYLPFMVLPIYTILEKLDIRLLEAASDLGAHPRMALRAVTIPLTISGVRAGFFLVFVATFGEYAIPVLLGGAKKLYVGSLITDYFMIAKQMSVGSAFTILSSIVLLCCAAILRGVLSKKVILKGVYR